MSILKTVLILLSLTATTFLIGQNLCEFEQKIISSETTDLQGFGVQNGAGVSGDYVVVGTLGDEQNGSQSGAAYFFERCGSEWTQIQKIVPDDNEAIDRFGRGAAIWGDYAIVGAPYDDDMGEKSGSAYIYHLEDGLWHLQEKIIAPDGSPSDWFGWTVSIWEDYVLVGSQNDFVESSFNGSAFIFKRDGTDWVFQNKLVAPDPGTFDLFGLSLDIRDGLAIVGAQENDDNGLESGSAYIYKLEGDTSWNYQAKLLPSDGMAGDGFGGSVNISEGRALVGSPYKNVNLNDDGAVYIFRNQGDSVWTEDSFIVSPENILAENFGLSVDADDEKVIVGTARGFGISEETGSAHLFSEVDGNFNYEMKLYADDGEHADFFSIVVGVDDNTLICGAQGDDSNGGNAGSAYMYHVDCAPMCTKIISPEVNGSMSFTNQPIEWAPVEIADGFMFGVGTEEGVYDIVPLTDVGDTTSYFVALEDFSNFHVSILPYNEFDTTNYCGANAFNTEFLTIQAILDEDIIVSCDAEIPEPVIQYVDSCGTVEVSFSEEILPLDCGTDYVIVRTLTVSDECGTSTTTQNVNVVDTEAPELIGSTPVLNVACGELIPLEEPIFVDNCNVVAIEFEDSGILDCGETIIRTFTATDPCGNASTVEQTITVGVNMNPPDCTILTAPIGGDILPDATISWAGISGAQGYILNVGTSDCTEFQFETMVLGVEEVDSDIYRFKVYPNPSSDGWIKANINIDLSAFDPSDLSIYDPLGRSVGFDLNAVQGMDNGVLIELSIENALGMYHMVIADEKGFHKASFSVIK